MAAAGLVDVLVAGSWAHKYDAAAARSATTHFILIIMILTGSLVMNG
jgi:hypothetical protein